MGVKKKKVDGTLAATFFLPIEWKPRPLLPVSSFSCRIYSKIAVPGTSCDFDEATMLTGSAAFDLAPRSVFSFRNACQPNLQGLASRKYSVAILGAGHGGLALAGYLAQHGHQVTLPEPDHHDRHRGWWSGSGRLSGPAWAPGDPVESHFCPCWAR